jgi:hypothetical protein
MSSTTRRAPNNMSKFGLQFQIVEGKCTIFVLDGISLLQILLAMAYDYSFIPPPPLTPLLPQPHPHCKSLDKLPYSLFFNFVKKLKWALT